VFLLHVWAILVAIFREVCYEEWIYRDFTKVCEPVYIRMSYIKF